MTDLSVQQPTEMTLVERVMGMNATIEQMKEFMGMQMQIEENRARNAFNMAMAQFKAAPPEIRRNKHVEHNDFWHATIDEVVGKIAPALAAVGIRHRWDIDQNKLPMIAVTCILSHAMGHSESTSLSAGPDTTGAKNAVQAIGSTVTYLQRYTLLAATGMAAVGTDNDGNATVEQVPVKPRIDEKTLTDHLAYIEVASCMADLQKGYLLALKDAEAVNDKEAIGKLAKAKNARKKELAEEGQ